jgi:Zn-dependent protease
LMVPFWIGVDASAHPEFWAGFALLAFLQLMASVLNLLPVPGLDGGNIVQPWLSPQWQRGYDQVAPFGFLLLFALLWNERTGRWFFDAVFAVGDALGLPAYLYSDGFALIHFW